MSAAAERRRLDTHFRAVLRHLHRNPPPGLGPAQRIRRAKHLERLERYRRRGRFPLNRGTGRVRTPVFVDARGTRCAMGQLLDLGGGAELTRHIARTRNTATVAELAAIPELLAWLEAQGLTPDEAALIQPAYCSQPAACNCGELARAADELMEAEVVEIGDQVVVEVLATIGDEAGLAVGERVPVAYESAMPYEVGDVVYGVTTPETTFGVAYRTDDTGLVTMYSCAPDGGAPAGLPREVFVDAALASTEDACAAVLEAHDPAWAEYSGGGCNGAPWDPDPAADGPVTAASAEAGGCAVHPGLAGPPTFGIVSLAAAIILLRRRQNRR